MFVKLRLKMQRARREKGSRWNYIVEIRLVEKFSKLGLGRATRGLREGTRTRFAKMCHRFADFRRVPVNHVVRGKYTRPGEVKLARASNRVNDTHPTCNGKDRARCSSLIRRGND